MSEGSMSMIDCKKFRAQKLADPMCRDAAVKAHAAHCPPCAQYAVKLEQFEQKLRCAAVDACGDMPPNLCERILAQLGQPPATGSEPAPRKSWFATLLDKFGGGGTGTWFAPTMGAMAMTLVLGIAGLIAFNLSNEPSPMARSVIAHVVSEPGIFEFNEDVPASAVQAAFAQLGGRVEESLGQVRHLGVCYVEGKLAHHLLVQTPDGEASLVLLPGEALEGGVLSEKGFSATFIPLPKGSLGIITRSEREAHAVKARLERSVRVES